MICLRIHLSRLCVFQSWILIYYRTLVNQKLTRRVNSPFYYRRRFINSFFGFHWYNYILFRFSYSYTRVLLAFLFLFPYNLQLPIPIAKAILQRCSKGDKFLRRTTPAQSTRWPTACKIVSLKSVMYGLSSSWYNCGL